MKAFDTMDHTMLIAALKRYGDPPKLRSATRRMYKDLLVVLKIGKVKEEMVQTIGVRQGEYMTPVLFLFMVMEFSESLKK